MVRCVETVGQLGPSEAIIGRNETGDPDTSKRGNEMSVTTDEEAYSIEVSFLSEPSEPETDRRQRQRRMEIGRRTREERRTPIAGTAPQPPRSRLNRRGPGERRRLPDRRIGSGAARELSQIDFSELDAGSEKNTI